MKNRSARKKSAAGRRGTGSPAYDPKKRRPPRPPLNLSIRAARRDPGDALANVTEYLRPGDVVNLSGRNHWWEPWFVVANAGIRGNQKRIFGRQSIWNDTHCMLYLDPDHTVSVQPPRGVWRTPAEYCRERVSIWRFTKRRAFSDFEIGVMRDYAAEHLIGKPYDVGQLLDILVNTILGYPNVLRYRVFDFGRSLKVCSVGVRVLFERLRQVLDENGLPSFDRLFRTPNPLAPWPGGVFPQSRIPNQYGVDVESTAPAHFANSHYFDDEFELIAVFDDGWPVYPAS